MANLKNIKKGDKVIMRLFTGAFSGVKVVEKADANFIYFTTGKGMSKFSRKTGKMIDPAPKTEAYANYIEEYDADVEAEEVAKKENARVARAEKLAAKKAEEKAAKKAAKKKKKPEPEEEEEELEEEEEQDEDDEEEEEAPKKKPVKKVAKKVAKKPAKKKPVDEDEDDFEEME